MYNIILNIIRMYKMFNFKKNGTLEIDYNGSKLALTPKGDIIINAKRHIIYNRTLSFDGCPPDFIERTIKAHEENRLEQQLETEYIDLQLQAEVLKCRSEQ